MLGIRPTLEPSQLWVGLMHATCGSAWTKHEEQANRLPRTTTTGRRGVRAALCDRELEPSPQSAQRIQICHHPPQYQQARSKGREALTLPLISSFMLDGRIDDRGGRRLRWDLEPNEPEDHIQDRTQQVEEAEGQVGR